MVVDDDRRLRELLHRYLGDQGFRVTVASDAAEARALLKTLVFDLLVLDVMMPGESGLDLTTDLRRRGDVPILLLTAMTETQDRISGLELGADDYLTKPFEPAELVARIRGILRRARVQTEAKGEISLGRYRFDLDREVLASDAGPVRLTTSEVQLLRVLASQPGTPVSRDDLQRLSGLSGGGRAIDVQVARLRRKIEPTPKVPRYLQTVRGQGYVLQPD
ncbi:MAG: response regulator [Alphaproteobacteria bacterium]|nr:response regulator [Alphaproteobacteria bacterium]MCZ6764832.1 response regulator [Alphaproteobacteria bacterium]